jgi:type II secretory pathway pseudopilin PulG
MKINTSKKVSGMTLIEVTLVIAVLLGLISVLFIGVAAYKEGSDRAKCILNIATVQKAGRSYQNMNEIDFNDGFAETDLVGDATKMFEVAPECPSEGTYGWVAVYPAVGTPFIECSLNDPLAENHVPSNTNNW